MFGSLFSEDGDDGSGGGLSSSSGYVEPPQPPRSKCLLAGLDNQGATCYLNSLLQVLFMSPEFRKGIYDIDPYSLGIDGVIEEEAAEKQAEAEVKKSANKASIQAKQNNEVVPDAGIIAQLVGMGCSIGGSKKSCIAVKNSGVDAAMDYYFSHAEEEGFDKDDDEDDEEEGMKEGEEVKNKAKKTKVRRTVIELQRLFTQLQLADQRSMSTDLLTTKGFNFKSGDASVQHDVQELITMLLDKLDYELGKKPKKAQTPPTDMSNLVEQKLIPRLFELTSRTELQCLTCGATSGPPSETNKNFFVPIKGFENMSSALGEVFRGEVRRTDCEACGAKRDKSCSLAVHKLPPLLWCSLMRFDFDWQKQQRTKINDSFEFPLVLDMRPHVPETAAPLNPSFKHDASIDRSVSLAAALRDIEHEIGDQVASGEEMGSSMKDCDVLDPLLYDLVGVVLHNGSGYSGHYVSLVRDQLCESRFQPEAVIPSPPRTRQVRIPYVKSSDTVKSPVQIPSSDELQTMAPVELLRVLLRTCSVDPDKGTHTSSVDNLATLVHKHSGRPWGKMHKKKHGSILNFVKEQPNDFFVDETSCVALITNDNIVKQEESTSSVDASRNEDGWTSVVSKKSSKDVAKEVALQEEENAAKQVRGRKVACLSAQRWGRWFQFNDSAVSPIPLSALSDAFAGRSSAYMLLYRSRGMGALKQDTSIEALLTETEMSDEMVKSSSPLPPEYWSNWIKQWNLELDEARKKYEASSHAVKVTFVCPGHISADEEGKYPLHLVLREDEVAEVSSAVGKPFQLDVDVRSSVSDLREKLAHMIGRQAAQLGVKLPNASTQATTTPSQRASSAIRLHVLQPHGPGYIISTEIGVKKSTSSSLGYAAVAKDAGMTCGEAFGAETEVTVLCWDGLSVNRRKVDTTGVAPLELQVTTLGAAVEKKSEKVQDIELKSGDYSKLTVRKVVGGKGKSKPSPLVEVLTYREPMFVARAMPTEELVMLMASKYGISPDRLVLHIIDTNDKISLLHSPAGKNKKDNRGLKLESCNKCELMVEDLDARGFFTQSLAETELLKRQRKRTVQVLSLVPPPLDSTQLDEVKEATEEAMEETMTLSFGTFGIESGVEKEKKVEHQSNFAPVGTEIEVDCEGEVTVCEFRKQILKHLGLLSCEDSTRLKFSASSIMAGEILVDETMTLEEAKVLHGSSLTLEVGARAKRGETTIRFKVKDHDQFEVVAVPRSVLEVTVKETASVKEVKELMCGVAGVEGPRRLRFTNWAEEEGSLVPEVDEALSNDVEVYLTMKDAGLVGYHELLLLEPGRVPRKGELHLHLLLWSPNIDSVDAGGAEGMGIGEGGAVALSKQVRGSCLKPLFSIESAHVDHTLSEFKQQVSTELLSFVSQPIEEESKGEDEEDWKKSLRSRCQSSEQVDQLFELRMLRSDLLPGKWLMEDKSLGKCGLKSGAPLLVIPTSSNSNGWFNKLPKMGGEMTPPPIKALDIFVTRRTPPVQPAQDKSDNLPLKKCAPLLWPPISCAIDREGGFHTYDELKQMTAKLVGIDLEHAVIARHDFAKCSWTVLNANMKTKKQNKSKGKVIKGGARNVCQAPFSVKPGDLIGVLDDRELDSVAAIGADSGQVSSEYLLSTAFDTAADVQGREATRCAEKDKKKATTPAQQKRARETVLDIGNFNWDESDGEESD